ncbi:single-stranded DNA-binding protein [uncultured Megamonas sp.]|uniref:single-stranded DNA-binding protein n=1 Tax=uncultured Megamonas sp. TaxID=286140 RepID=UPI00266E9DEE|nr:single-stranded DNA-binding protein [uncultured Megamonas sp.]
MNKVILAGRLVRDPEVRYTQTGKAVASFTLAVNRRFSRSADQQTADFIPIVVWDKLAEVCGNNLVKGSQVLIEGRIQIRSYDAQDGSKRYVTEVIAQELEFMGSRPASAPAPAQQFGGAQMQTSSPMGGAAASFGSEVPPDEEIPF